MNDRLRVAGLFAGIGGIELGLAAAGHRAELLNELDSEARRVLATRFPGVPITEDVRSLRMLPEVDLIAAGFPCTDISQAGKKVGIAGQQSGLVDEVFRLAAAARRRPQWMLLENVSYMLRLDGGAAMRHVINGLESMGYQWAYRVIDARAFGLPQRRQRVLILASLDHDPRSVLFADDVSDPATDFDDAVGSVDQAAAYGFYWTEGLRGLGWVKDAVPTIKGGSALGIPSPPAVWLPSSGEFGTPQLEDAERLQGFAPDWTEPALEGGARLGVRWRQIGNAVTPPMSRWIGERLRSPGPVLDREWDRELPAGSKWPIAAYGAQGRIYRAPLGMRPFAESFSLRKFLDMPLKPLSAKASLGFLNRAHRGRLRFADGFIEALTAHADGQLSRAVQ